MKHILKHLLRLLYLVILFPLGGSPVKAQAHDSDPIDIPASSPNGVSVNQMVYIANAVDHLQANKTPESAALLFYILKAYQDNPNLQPGIALRLLLTARDKYDKRYRSTVVQANYKFHMQPFDILSNMLAILALMPNNSVSFQCNLESLNYVTHAGNHLSDGNDWLETGQGDARLRASGGYEDYLQTQLSGVYLLAQNNSNVAQLVDNFFGGAFNASVYDSGLTILSNNPALRDSQNFHPLVNMIGANGAIHTTFLQARLMIEGFFDRMSTAAQNSITALGSMTNLQKNYAASFQDPNTLQQMQALVNDNSATNAPLLQSADAFAAVGWQTLAVSPSYKAYKQTTACLRTAAKAAAFAGDTIEAVGEGMKVPPNVAGAVGKGFKATGNGLDMVANALDVDAAFGVFGDSPESLTLKGVNKIGESLDALQTQMNKRLDVIDHNILQLYTQMNSQFNNITNLLVNGFNQVNTAVLNMQSQLLNIQSKIDRLTQTIDVFAQQAGRHDLVQSLQTIDLYVRNPPNANCDTSLTFYNTTYVPNYITCLGFATFHAVTDLGEVGLPLANRQYDSFSVENELNSNPELNINYVLQYANVHFYAKQFTQEDALFAPIQPLPTGVANPRSWEMSVLGMMRLASTFPNCYQASTLNDTQKSGQGFFAAYNRGNAIQSVVAQTTVEPSNNGLGFQKSQLFPNLILNHNLKAKALSDAILAVENDYLNTHPNAPAQDIVAAVKFQWNTTNPSANGQLLQNYAKAFS